MRIIAAAFAATALSLPLAASAQSVVGEPGSVSAGVSYALGVSSKIVETEGVEVPNVNVQHHIMMLWADYATPLEGLAVEAQLPIVGTKWDDSSLPHFPAEGEWDDGDLHLTPTDARVGLRYHVLRNPFDAAISLAGSTPVKDYPTFGYTAPARGLKALHAGVAASRGLHPFLPRLYFYGSYEFSLVESYDEIPETEDFGQNRSRFSLQSGYYVLDELDVHLTFDGSITHGGIDFIDWDSLSAEVQGQHDAVLRERAYLLGGGASYFLTDTLALAAEFRLFVAGANTRNSSLFALAAQYQIN